MQAARRVMATMVRTAAVGAVATTTAFASEAPAVCPVNHTAAAVVASETPVVTSPPVVTSAPAVCPVNHGKAPRCPVNHGDRMVNPNDANKYLELDANNGIDVSKIENANVRSGFIVPSTGRGNSDDGAHWLNPTPLELYRSLKAKHPNDEDLTEELAEPLSFNHDIVVSSSWAGILEWEDKYIRNGVCPQGPRLAGFAGKQTTQSPKARFYSSVFGVTSYDRHDWIIDRCGKEVRYVLDYYDPGNDPSIEDGLGTVDVRPALDSFEAASDRISFAVDQFKKGERWW